MTRRQTLGLIVLLGALPIALASVAAILTLPLFPHPIEQSTFTVQRGYGLRQVLADGYDRGIINTPRFTEWLARIAGRDTPKAGTYRLPDSGSDWSIIKTLDNGNVETTAVTILEGWTAAQIASELDRAGVADKDEFLIASTNKTLLNRYGIVATEVEGYLFPETYRFAYDLPAASVADVMLQTFFNKIPATYETLAKRAQLGMHDAVILASIIQAESYIPHEMPTVSSVYHNRLRRSMRLQADPTLTYRMPGYRGDITFAMKKTPTPYNTYLIKGLPAGPIGNPGLDALLAAVLPKQTDYLFFVAAGDGEHDFSVTYAEHLEKMVHYGLYTRRRLDP